MTIKRRYGRSNLFSESHRVCLPSNYCLFDIDGILLDEDNDPKFLYEEKYKMDTIDRGNFIDTFYRSTNVQASYLRHLSQKVRIYIKEEITDKWWYVEDRDLNETEDPGLNKVKTENRIYVQDILSGYTHTPSGIFVRTEGEKPSDMEKYGKFVADLIDVPIVLVNDVFESDYIHFKKENTEFKCGSEDLWNEQWDDIILV